jgi:1,4-dihydroxy-2-naphthoyl-CoA hydrolase
MFVYETDVKLMNTDATGALYFPEQFKMASEAFEAFLKMKGYPLKKLFASPYLLPVVHAQADYIAPVKAGDSLQIILKTPTVGTTSVTLELSFYAPQQDKEVGRVKIVHVLTDKNEKKPIPIPEFLKEIFEQDVVLKGQS